MFKLRGFKLPLYFTSSQSGKRRFVPAIPPLCHTDQITRMPSPTRQTATDADASEVERRKRVENEIAQLEEIQLDLEFVQGAMQDPDLPRALRVEFGGSFLHPDFGRFSVLMFYLRYALDQPHLPQHQEIEGALDASKQLVDELFLWKDRVSLAFRELSSEPIDRQASKSPRLLQAYDPFAPMEPWLLVALSAWNKRQSVPL